MDIISFLITIFNGLIGSVIGIFLMKLYKETRYIPTFTLGLFFFLLSSNFFLIIPLYLPINDFFAIISLDISVYVIFITFLFFVLALEGLKGNHFSPVFTGYAIFTALIIGFFIRDPSWTNVYNPILQVWEQPVDIYVDSFFLIHISIAFIIIFYRLIQYVKGIGDSKKKQKPIIAIITLTVSIFGAIISYYFMIPNFDLISFSLGMSIIAIIYIKYPNSFFLSNTRIEAILCVEGHSKVVTNEITTSKDQDLNLAAAGLGGIMTLLQEILQEKEPPTQLIHGKKGFLIEHDQQNKIFAILIVDQINEELRPPLKNAVSRFITRYEKDLDNWTGEVQKFDEFNIELEKIFRFAL